MSRKQYQYTYDGNTDRYFNDRWLLLWDNKYEFTYEEDITLLLKAQFYELELLGERLNKPFNKEELDIIKKYLPNYKYL